MDTEQDQLLLQNITLRAGTALVHYQVSKWVRGEGCSLTTPEASGTPSEISALPQWLRVDIAYLPFYLPNSFEDEGMSSAIRTHRGQAEYLWDKRRHGGTAVPKCRGPQRS